MKGYFPKNNKNYCYLSYVKDNFIKFIKSFIDGLNLYILR